MSAGEPAIQGSAQQCGRGLSNRRRSPAAVTFEQAAHALARAPEPKSPVSSSSLWLAADPDFCVVIRTYWGHGQQAGDGGLRRMLRSLQRQTVQS